MQQEMQPQYPQPYSVPGYRYCELLLADVCLRISRLKIECRTRNAEIRCADADTDENQNRPIVDSASGPATSACDIPGSTFDIPSGLSELQSEIESLRNRAETTLTQQAGSTLQHPLYPLRLSLALLY